MSCQWEPSTSPIVDGRPDDYARREVPNMLKPGDRAPDFTLPDGRPASTLWETGPIALFFFPRAFTAG